MSGGVAVCCSVTANKLYVPVLVAATASLGSSSLGASWVVATGDFLHAGEYGIL